jgi:hypothetical protein
MVAEQSFSQYIWNSNNKTSLNPSKSIESEIIIKNVIEIIEANRRCQGWTIVPVIHDSETSQAMK